MDGLGLFADIALGAPPRSTRCLPLLPSGLGSGFQESFQSFFRRLFSVHGTPSLLFLRRELFPLLTGEWNNWRMFSLSYRSTFLVAGGTPDGDQVAQAVVNLTGLQSIPLLRQPFLATHLTLCHRSLREHLAWCPQCFLEWHDRGLPLFFPLVWAFKFVVVRPRHGTPLVTECSSCGQRFRHLETRALADHCPRCAASLLTTPSSPVSSWELRIAQAMHDLLEWSARASAPFESCLLRNIRAAVAVVGDYSSLARAIGLLSHNLCAWSNSHPDPPELPALLRLSLAFGVPPGDLGGPLSSLQLVLRDPVPADISCLAPKQYYLPREQVEPFLRAALSDPTPRSVTALARDLGTSLNNVRAFFPDLCTQLSSRHRRFLSLARQRKDAQRAVLVREAMAHFSSTGDPFVAPLARRYLNGRWKESPLHLDLDNRRILAGDPAYSFLPEDVPAFQ